MLSLFAATVAEFPRRIAVCENERSIAYIELDARANALAVRLRAAGVRRQDRVALVSELG